MPDDRNGATPHELHGDVGRDARGRAIIDAHQFEPVAALARPDAAGGVDVVGRQLGPAPHAVAELFR